VQSAFDCTKENDSFCKPTPHGLYWFVQRIRLASSACQTMVILRCGRTYTHQCMFSRGAQARLLQLSPADILSNLLADQFPFHQ